MNNVIPLPIQETPDLHDEILAELGSRKARNLEIDPYDYIELLNLETSFIRIRDFFLRERLITKREWNRAIEIRKVRDELGGDPKTPAIFLRLYCEKLNIKVNYKKSITQQTTVHHEGYDVVAELAKTKERLTMASLDERATILQEQRLYEDILACKARHITTEDLARTLRIKARELDLRFTAGDIDDVIQDWLKTEQLNRRAEIFTHILHGHSRVSKEEVDQLWQDMVGNTFDTSLMDVDFVAAILKKFMWQVKRKIQNLSVSNHLMPIILGVQGTGKSEWMKRLVGPLCELTASTDFNQITDDRNIDIWENSVLILDEMGYASKADIDIVKNLITSETLVRRVMRTNNVVIVKQSAVFIGASNREIDQLIRDETGARRFIGIRFKKQSDFDFTNSVDFHALWQSVDERGEDPLSDFQSRMKIAQEEIRVMNPCEEWAYLLPNGFGAGNFMHSTALYVQYKEWESDHYGKKRLDHDEWSKEMRRLIHSIDEFPFEVKPNGKGYMYKFTGRVTDK